LQNLVPVKGLLEREGSLLSFSDIGRLVTPVIMNRTAFFFESSGTSVGIATGYELDDREVGVRVPLVSRMITSSYHPDRESGPPNLLPNAYRGLFSRGGKAAGT
jgi:hypothetical protein